MLLFSTKIKGFRNYKEATINFCDKSLIIGSNDVGKTNLIWAIRLLLDRSLSDLDIEPKDSDFYAYEETHYFEIVLFFKDITEDCVISKLKGKISDQDELVLCYKGYRDKITGFKSYELFAGSSYDSLEEIDDRFYRKVLNLKYISCKRDFHSYINKEKTFLFETAKEQRTEEEKNHDEELYQQIKEELKIIDEKIPQLNFISSATNKINEELNKLSLHHNKQDIVFEASSSNVDKFIKNVSISSVSDDKCVLIGGDGRLNQIYLALWASRNDFSEENLKEVTIFCIEEPEAHLHPHQQRKLADYLVQSLKGQVVLTSHSPQIASEFSPNSIIRLFNANGATRAASEGCSTIVKDSFNDFGYRMSIIPAEAFFSDIVLLVEGISEEWFYKTLAKQIGIDIDRLNISILMVDGIGFIPFIKILHSLEIEWILRTDNDISKIPNKNEWAFSGLQRGLRIYKRFIEIGTDENIDKIIDTNEPLIKGFNSETPPSKNIRAAKKLIHELECYNIFFSNNDLENDLVNSPLEEELKEHFGLTDSEKVVAKMQKKKGTFLYKFLKEYKDSLCKLADHSLALPLIRCKNHIHKL